jgi:hypothetical protein
VIRVDPVWSSSRGISFCIGQENAHRIMWRKAHGAQTERDLPSGWVIRFLGSPVQPIHVPKAYSDSTTTNIAT